MARSGAGKELRGKPHRPLERQSREYVGVAIMGYLVHLREQPEEGFEVGVSPYTIMRKVPDLNTQKQDRVEYILELLELPGARGFRCRKCTMAFIDQTSLDAHIARRHPE